MSGGPEPVAASRRRQGRTRGPPLDHHRQHEPPGEHSARQPPPRGVDAVVTRSRSSTAASASGSRPAGRGAADHLSLVAGITRGREPDAERAGGGPVGGFGDARHHGQRRGDHLHAVRSRGHEPGRGRLLHADRDGQLGGEGGHGGDAQAGRGGELRQCGRLQRREHHHRGGRDRGDHDAGGDGGRVAGRRHGPPTWARSWCSTGRSGR